MLNLLSKSLLTIICICYAINFSDYNTLALTALSAISCALVIELLNKKIALTTLIIFSISSLFFPLLLYFSPLVIEPCHKFKKIVLILPIVSLLLKQQFDLLLLCLILLAYLIGIILAELDKYKNIVYEKEDILNSTLSQSKKQALQLLSENEKNKEIAILSERNKIARIIHDSVGHTIASAIIQTEAMKALANPELLEPIDNLQENLKSGMSDIRLSLHQLHDKSINLELCLKELTAQSEMLDIEMKYKLHSELSYDAKTTIISLIKESITNCLKHSAADKMQITLIEMPKHLSITIIDNGKEQTDNFKKGLGFHSFNEFAQKHNGNFNVDFTNGANLMFLLEKETLLER